jgi:hypothetical protein
MYLVWRVFLYRPKCVLTKILPWGGQGLNSCNYMCDFESRFCNLGGFVMHFG